MWTSLNINIGKEIVEIRKKHGLKQRHLAELLVTDIKSISRMENGKSFPGIYELLILKKEFNLDIYEAAGLVRDFETESAESTKELKKIKIALIELANGLNWNAK